jgi:hypothetical protein
MLCLPRNHQPPASPCFDCREPSDMQEIEVEQ